MSRWPTKPLGELCLVNPRLTSSERPAPETAVTFVPMAAVDEVEGRIAQPEVRTYKQVSKGYTSFKENDVLFAKITPCMQNGKAAIAQHLESGLGFGSTEFHVLRPNRQILPGWLFAFIRQPSFRSAAEANFTGSAGQKRVPADFLKKYLIPIPPLVEQERIVALLDEADELRKLRAKADRRAADLIPALFHEMFGDPATNPRAWPIQSIGTLFDGERGGAKCGPFGSALKKNEYLQAGVPVWGIPNVQPNQFEEYGSLFISPEKYQALQAYRVQYGDLLISRAGTVGRICVAEPTTDESIIGTNLIRVATDKNKVEPVFLSSLLTHFLSDVGNLRANADEGSYSFMNTGILKRLKVYVPPISLQHEFAKRVTEIRAMEAEQATSRKRLDNLFQSMLHRAFEPAGLL